MQRTIALIALVATIMLAGCSAFSFEQAAPTPVVTHDSPFGPMGRYTTPSGRIAFDFPADWSDAAGDDRRCRDAIKCLISRDNEFMLVRVGPLAEGGAPADLSAYVDDIVTGFEATTADATFLERRPVDLSAGLEGEVLRYAIESDLVSVKELFATDGEEVVAVAFITWNEGFAAMEPVADYVFGTLEATSQP